MRALIPPDGAIVAAVTAQISDSVQLEGEHEAFSIAGVSGGPLFEPAQHGLKPVMISTACWRGWYATYAVRDRQLLIASLAIGLDHTQPLPTLEGLSPQRRSYEARELKNGEWVDVKATTHEWFFEPLTLPVPFTGGLLLARGFIRELYVHMGHHPAWKYEEVVELTFVDGRLATMQSRSEAMAKLRSELANRDKPARGATRDEVSEWIEGTFSLRYPGFGE
ncbi:MAG: hypothetical protein DI536_18100 [Archangium gephyra]|uniref:Uncharacterized protein n=1 Tax=Archangium gephyra TaxID=48 RepID=A0A2W5TCZ7_9BACT|nr:MAG: hypothetical protein DI536_18100 [Archangium gephyra]